MELSDPTESPGVTGVSGEKSNLWELPTAFLRLPVSIHEKTLPCAKALHFSGSEPEWSGVGVTDQVARPQSNSWGVAGPELEVSAQPSLLFNSPLCPL